MPNLFVRTTPLPDLAGRLDYIANPDRQENLLAVYDSAESLLYGQYWQVLAQECQAAFAQSGKTTQRVKDKKTGEFIEQELKCREGREVHFLLSNSLLDRMDPDEIARTISETIEEKLGLPNRVALHRNKSKKSFHAHVILPERHLLQEPEIKIAERNLFFDAQGKRRYRKSDILDTNGQLLPGCRICKKGEVYQQHYFSGVDTDINTRAWLKSVKTDVILQLRNGVLRGDVEITEYDPSTGKLAQQYVGPKVLGEKKAAIEAGNEMVKIFNGMVDAGKVTHDEAMRIQAEYNQQADRNAYLARILEEMRLREIHEREIRKAAEEKKLQQQVYSRPGWIRSSDGRPYRIRKYDETGRERTLIELVIILAVVTIRNENPVEPPKHVDRPIYAKVDYKVQAMLDTVRVAREEGIQNPIEIDERLQRVGKELSKARTEARRLAESKGKMDVLAQAIADRDRLEELCERIYAMKDGDLDKHIQMAQNAANLERYKVAKATIYRAGISAPEACEEFLGRYKSISQKATTAEKAAGDLKEEYRKLSKLRHNVQLAQNRRYCYDAAYCPAFDEEQIPEIEPRETKRQEHGGFTNER